MFDPTSVSGVRFVIRSPSGDRFRLHDAASFVFQVNLLYLEAGAEGRPPTQAGDNDTRVDVTLTDLRSLDERPLSLEASKFRTSPACYIGQDGAGKWSMLVRARSEPFTAGVTFDSIIVEFAYLSGRTDTTSSSGGDRRRRRSSPDVSLQLESSSSVGASFIFNTK